MSTSPLFRESLLSGRTFLADERHNIREQHRSGSPGIQVCARLTEMVDTVVLNLFAAALNELPDGERQHFESNVALVAHGGYGRRDLAPYSDVDLMVLHAAGAESAVFPLTSRLLRDLFDVGLDLQQSVRTPRHAWRLAAQDPVVCTALMESRLLAGNPKLFETFYERFERRTRARYRGLYHSIFDARRKERQQYGETVYLLEPNVKRSRGSLRDLQLMRWLGFARFGAADLDALQLMGAITKTDQRVLREAWEYLLRLRNELHFHAGKSNDVLDRSEQVRLAGLYEYQGTEGILPVEQFMSEYFRHTRAVRAVVSNFVANNRPARPLAKVFGALFGHMVEGDYRVTPTQIVATKRGLARLQSSLSEVLHLCELANLHNKRIAPATWEAVRAAVPKFTGDVSPEISRQFMALISRPGRLGELLRRLHELGVLEKIIPGFTHARCLLQFNEYHKYTVDEHCILAVERCTDFISDPGVLGRVYLGIKQKRTLHLALLIHDLGKGFVEDHSEVGLRIAGETAERLRLPLREAETLKFLVHKHLVMSHLAFRRDTHEDDVIVRFAVDVGSPEVLDMLFVLTAADFAAVGPGVWNSWKAEVLSELYRRTMRHLGGDALGSDSAERLQRRKAAVRQHLKKPCDEAWFHAQIEALPPSFAFSRPPERIAEELQDLHNVAKGEARARGRYLSDSGALEFVVGTHDDITPGVFHKLTGALASQGLEILTADINTLANGLVLDRFHVHDPDYAAEPPRQRIELVEDALVRSLTTPHGASPTFRKVWRSGASRERVALATLPTRVKIDNSTSDNFTIIDIFAHDRMGLLFTITRTIFEMGLSVAVAKIGTYLDQVVDVFYVTDAAGHKISDEGRLQEISARLLEAIDRSAQE
ncbi:MAG: [protein-PII] uridylyltransferase [Pirellulales bacterium]